MQIYCKKLSSAAPGVGAEEEQERENLESAEEHIERKDNLREIAVNAEILCGADKLKAWADVVEAGRDGGEIGTDGKAVHRDDGEAEHEDDAVNGKIGVDVVADLFADGAAVHINGLHAARVERLADGAANALHQEQNTGDLETAARAACAGADEHERKQDCFGKRRPLLEIDRAVARCGHDADDLKRRVVHGLIDRIVHAADIDGDENDGACGDAEIQAKLLVFEHRFELAEQEHVIKAEVHAEEEHEHGDDGLQEVAVPAHAAVFNGKAAGAGRAERDAEAVEHGHAAEQKTHNAQRGKQNVDSV